MLKDPTLSAYFRVLGFEIDDAACQHIMRHGCSITCLGSVQCYDSVQSRCNVRPIVSVMFTAESTMRGWSAGTVWSATTNKLGSSIYQLAGQGQGRCYQQSRPQGAPWRETRQVHVLRHGRVPPRLSSIPRRRHCSRHASVPAPCTLAASQGFGVEVRNGDSGTPDSARTPGPEIFLRWKAFIATVSRCESPIHARRFPCCICRRCCILSTTPD